MSTNLVRDGRILTWTNATSTDVESGDVIVIGDRIAVAEVDIAVDESGAVDTEGVRTLAKHTGEAFSQGDQLYWDETHEYLTATASGNTAAGFAAEDAGSSATTAECKING